MQVDFKPTGTEKPKTNSSLLDVWKRRLLDRLQSPRKALENHADVSVVTDRKGLDQAVFCINGEEDQRAKSEVINALGVKKGTEVRHLVDPDETVVSFKGSLQELVAFIDRCLEAPLIPTQTPSREYKDVMGQVLLRRSGLQVVRPVFKSETRTYLPECPDHERLEVVGVKYEEDNGEGLVTLFTMSGPKADFPLHHPKYDEKDYKETSEKIQRLDQSRRWGEIDPVDRAIEHPYRKPEDKEFIKRSRDEGAVYYQRSSYDNRTGYSDAWFGVQFVRPSVDQSIASNTIETFYITREKLEKGALSRIVVPAAMTEDLE